MAHKTCTIIVTYNRLQLLKGAVNALRNQSCGSTIVVVNNGSTDGTREYLDSQKDLTAIHQDNSGGSGGFFTGRNGLTGGDTPLLLGKKASSHGGDLCAAHGEVFLRFLEVFERAF